MCGPTGVFPVSVVFLFAFLCSGYAGGGEAQLDGHISSNVVPMYKGFMEGTLHTMHLTQRGHITTWLYELSIKSV